MSTPQACGARGCPFGARGTWRRARRFARQRAAGVALTFAALTFAPAALIAQVAPADPAADPPAETEVDLTDLSLDELFEINIEITSVGKRTQKLAGSASAVHVLTGEDIRRSGFKTLPELLRLVPGLHVARVNGGAWAISSRGFNGQYNGNMLVLIDGRSLYTTLFAGVFWDAQDIPVEDIERIEVVLGPGGPAWGSNALNGVINVVTRSAADTQGTLVSLQAGDELGPDVLVRHGAVMEDGHWRAWVRASGNDAMHGTNAGGGNDERDLLRTGFRVDWDSNPDQVLTIDGDVYDGTSRSQVNLPSLSAPFLLPTQEKATVSGSHLLLAYTTHDGPSESTTLQASWDGTHRKGDIAEEERHAFDVEWQRRRSLGKHHDLVFGADIRTIDSDFDDSPTVVSADPNRRMNQQSVFLEDQIGLVPDRLSLTIGARLEHHNDYGTDLQPSVRLAWTPTENHTFWAAVSHSQRTPSQLEHDGTVLLAVQPDSPPGFDTATYLVGDEDVESMELTAFELGWRARVTPRLMLDVAAFHNRFRNGVIYSVGAPDVGPDTITVPLELSNDGKNLARGFEISGAFEARQDWRLTAGWAYLDVHSSTEGDTVSAFGDDAEGTAPRSQLLFTSRHNLTETLDFDLLLFHVDELKSRNVPAYWSADLRLGFRPDTATEWSLGVHNLFHDHEPEWAGEPYGGASESETSLWLGYTRRF